MSNQHAIPQDQFDDAFMEEQARLMEMRGFNALLFTEHSWRFKRVLQGFGPRQIEIMVEFSVIDHRTHRVWAYHHTTVQLSAREIAEVHSRYDDLRAWFSDSDVLHPLLVGEYTLLSVAALHLSTYDDYARLATTRYAMETRDKSDLPEDLYEAMELYIQDGWGYARTPKYTLSRKGTAVLRLSRLMSPKSGMSRTLEVQVVVVMTPDAAAHAHRARSYHYELWERGGYERDELIHAEHLYTCADLAGAVGRAEAQARELMRRWLKQGCGRRSDDLIDLCTGLPENANSVFARKQLLELMECYGALDPWPSYVAVKADLHPTLPEVWIHNRNTGQQVHVFWLVQVGWCSGKFWDWAPLEQPLVEWVKARVDLPTMRHFEGNTDVK